MSEKIEKTSESPSKHNPLTAMIEKVPNPIDKITTQLEICGIYCIPEEGKTVEENNQNLLFSGTVKFLKMDIPNGKVIPRQLTEKELKEIEEEKIKKKQPKGKPVEPSPEELEKLKKQKELEEQEEKKFLEEGNKLSEETKINRTNEDKYKAASIQFEKNAMSAGTNRII